MENSFAEEVTGLFAYFENERFLIPLIIFIAGIVFTRLFHRRDAARTLLEKEVADAQSWPHMIEKYSTGWHEAYFTWITRLTTWADRFYGPRLFSARALGRCFDVALLYPILALLFTWALFGQGELGGIVFFQKELPFWRRALGVILWFVSFSVLLLYFVRSKDIVQWIKSKIPISYRGRIGDQYVEPILFVVAGAIAVAVAAVGVISFAGDGAVGVAGTVAGAVAAAGGVVSVSAIAVFVALLFIFSGQSDEAEVLLLFYFIFPFLNALTDYLSIGATRWFLRGMGKKRPSVGMIIFKSLLDFLWGGFCLVLLIALIIGSLELWQASGLRLTFDWRLYWADIQTHGLWSHGGLLVVMLFTTLLPTALHVAIGLSGALLSHQFAYKEALVLLHRAQSHKGHKELSVAEQHEIVEALTRGNIRKSRVFWITFVMVVAVLLWVDVRVIEGLGSCVEAIAAWWSSFSAVAG